ncbi:MAG: hypothetical protein KJ626_05265 [Verrucomicrobia bacterium]|nr:hypothetical protein [Verrucomicrobiota bacterium]
MAEKSIGDKLRISAVVVALLATIVSIALVLMIRPALNGALEEADQALESDPPTNTITAIEPQTEPEASSDGGQAAGVLTETDSDIAAYPELDAFEPGFFETSLYVKWEKEGVTRADLASAVRLLKAQGFEGLKLQDPNLIAQFLPYRNIEPAYVDSITVEETVDAGQPVAFQMSANYPDPSYVFERWEIEEDAGVITVRMVGSKTGNPVAAVVVPVELEGEIPALAAGEYTVRFVAIGEPIEKNLSVR